MKSKVSIRRKIKLVQQELDGLILAAEINCKEIDKIAVENVLTIKKARDRKAILTRLEKELETAK